MNLRILLYKGPPEKVINGFVYYLDGRASYTAHIQAGRTVAHTGDRGTRYEIVWENIPIEFGVKS